MWKCADVRRVCEGVSMKMCVWEDVRCEYAKIQDEKIYAKIWRHEDMKIGRCITDANDKPNY